MSRWHGITPAQCRAARAVLGMTLDQLWEMTDVSRPTIHDFEKNERTIHKGTADKLRRFFESRGIRFDAPETTGIIPPSGHRIVGLVIITSKI